MSETQEQTELFKTEDMALATVLVMNDHRYTTDVVAQWSERRGSYDKKVQWCFPISDLLMGLVDDYRAAVIEVEPKEFVQAWSQVRNAMFETLRKR